MIKRFEGKYKYLSNFWNAPVMFEGDMYLNNEAAFQAAKIADREERLNVKAWQDGEVVLFTEMNPSIAKRTGRHVQLREDWEEVKEDVMYTICLDKFTRNKDLRDRLLSTGNQLLVEGNNWGDRVWGQVNGVGENRLGKILMRIRGELKDV